MHRESKRTVIVARNIAFCSGVSRAVSLAEGETKSSGKVYTVDSIVHNEEEVKRLEGIGIKKVSQADSGGVVILPAHGATSKEIASFSKKFAKVIDTTCPLVQRTVKIIKDMKAQGYKIAIVGDENHRETTVLKDTAQDMLYGVYADESAVKGASFVPKIAVVAQSTSTEDRLFGVAAKLLEKTTELRFFNTICSETIMRQSEAKELAGKVDCMIVIGGKTSANSQRLFEIVSSINPHSFFIHSLGDLEGIDIGSCNSVGITSGTSTPSWLIDEVIKIVSE
ncbi:MAG: 4-hydroxy-3-methylbut-2-enyl diphosphate reductase [Caldisericaceae bacterium]